MFTEKQLKDLLKAQSDLNNAYVNNWIKEVPLSKWLCAFQCEWGEFLESTPRFYGHKWWKPTLEDDVQNSKVEIVDMLHFGLSIALLKNTDFDYNLVLNDFNDLKDDKDLSLERSQKAFILTCHTGIEGENEKFLSVFFYLLFTLCEYVHWNFDDLYNAYWKKNELNLQRIRGGYMEGKYQKVDNDGNEDNRKLDI